MSDRDQLLLAIAAQERLRGTLSDDVVDATIAALNAQLTSMSGDDQSVPATPRPGSRRQATVLFADVAGFTAMSERIDPEVVAGLMNELWESVDDVIDRHGGHVDKHIGDAVMGVWGAGASREDDPERAVHAALALLVEFDGFRTRHALDVDVRIGVNTGLVHFGELGTTREATVTGDAVNIASRVEHAAPYGTVLVAHDTYRHVRGVFDVAPQDAIAVKGKSEPLRTYVVLRAKPRSFRLPTRGVEGVETRMIGRDAELSSLRNAYLTAVEQRCPQVVTVLGEAGVGKSRLLDEFTAWLDLRPEGIFYLKGRSVPDSVTVPRGLLREMFAYRFDIADDDDRSTVGVKLRAGLEALDADEADVIGHWLGFDLSTSAAVQQLSGSPEFGTVARAHVARYLAGQLATTPAVMLMEDIHWADGDSLAAIEQWIDQLPHAPLVVVCLARPLLVERNTGWPLDRAGWNRVGLEPLPVEDAVALVAEIFQNAESLPVALIDLIVNHADGNPLYVEELVKMLLDEGVVIASDFGPWEVALDKLSTMSVPPTLAGVLQARLDALSPPERSTLQHASVVGRTFWDEAVASLLTTTRAETVPVATADRSLRSIRGRELIRSNDRSTFSGCVEYKFKHALLRDASYESVLLRDRPRLHAAAAAWLETRAGDRLDEHLGPLAEHLGRAGDLGRAADLFSRAGHNAAATGSPRVARDLLVRSLEFRDRDGSSHGAAATSDRIELGMLLVRLRELDDARTQLSSGLQDADALGETPLVALAATRLSMVAMDEARWDEAGALVQYARSLTDGSQGEVAAEALLAEVYLHQARSAPAAWVELALEAVDAARASKHPELQIRALDTSAFALMRLDRFDEAEANLEEALAIARNIGNTWWQAAATSVLGQVAHCRAGADGSLAEAISLYEKALGTFETLGVPSASIGVMGDIAQATIERGELDHGEQRAHDHLKAAWGHNVLQAWFFGIVIHGQLALARGDTVRGLALIGAARADDRCEKSDDELRRILALYGIDPAAAEVGLAQGAHRRAEDVVAELLTSRGATTR